MSKSNVNLINSTEALVHKNALSRQECENTFHSKLTNDVSETEKVKRVESINLEFLTFKFCVFRKH